MDAVELNYPVDVVAPKLMGSESVENGEASALVSHSIERCSTILTSKDLSSTVKASESASPDKLPYTGCHVSGFHATEAPGRNSFGSVSHLLSTNELEAVQRRGKVSKNSNLCSKRPRMSHDSVSPAGVADAKYFSDQAGPHYNKCSSLEKQSVKQKNGISGKRGDRRNSRVSLKAKYDAFPLKMGSASFSSAAGGNTFFGAYGLKTDNNDVTELLDDLSLDDLLCGSYEAPRLGKERDKKAAITNENVLNTVRKAFSMLQLQRPVQSQTSADMDNCSVKNTSAYPNSASAEANVLSCDKGDPTVVDLSSRNKDPSSKHVNLLDSTPCKPIHVLEQLALPPPKDLESLLLDASKSLSRTASDLRSGKQIHRRTTLPPFPWSQTYSGHSRSNSDALKSPMTRNTCQGRWVKVGYISNPLRSTIGFKDLESLNYDQSLVPSGASGLGASGSVSFPLYDGVSSSFAATFEASSVHLESGGTMNSQENVVERCPRVLAAAQTLYEISTLPIRYNLDEINRWPKKPSQKVMKARKSRLNGKPDEILGSGSKNILNGADRKVSSKKPRISTVDAKRDVNHINSFRKGPLSVSTPRSSVLSPSNLSRDSVTEARHPAASVIRNSCMMPPPSRILDKANGTHKG